MRHKPRNKKYTNTEYFAEIFDEIERTELIDNCLEQYLEDYSPGGFFRCQDCKKILEFEYFDDDMDNVQDTCMDCLGLVYCCHYPDGAWTTISKDSILGCIYEDFEVVEGHRENQQPCTCSLIGEK